jgi:hypothetical protein
VSVLEAKVIYKPCILLGFWERMEVCITPGSNENLDALHVLNFALAFSEIIYAYVKQLLETNECFFTPLLSVAYKSLFDYRFSSSC